MDKFLTSVGTASGTNGPGQPCKASDVMHYYDGTTSPGAINLAAGNTGGVGLAINGAKLRVQTRTRSRRCSVGWVPPRSTSPTTRPRH